MKYIKILFTYGAIGDSWWKQRIRITSEINSHMGIVIQSYDLSPPPEEKIIVVRFRHPTSTLLSHDLDPLRHSWITWPSRNDLHSRSQAWDPLEKEATKDRGKPEVSLFPLLALCQLTFHIGQQ
jgi:hypothetical protein